MSCRVVCAVVAMLVAAAACSSGSGSDNAAPGCVDGQQAACECDDGSLGVKVCVAGQFDACSQCRAPSGGAGGGGGVAGTGGAGGNGAGGSHAGTGGSVLDASNEKPADAAFDVAAEADVQVGDPCPQDLLYDCSGECEAAAAECEEMMCNSNLQSTVVVSDGDFPVVVRTPAAPGIDSDCTDICGPNDTVFGLSLFLQPSIAWDATAPGVRVTVEPPWYITSTSVVAQYCLENSISKQECYAANSTLPVTHIQVLTTDPQAPARNVTIELLEMPVECPE